jgi:hypothetical protein
MQFTEIQNIIGANSASGNLSAAFPAGPHPATAITTGTTGGSITGSTTFTVPVLDTQDFYEGLLEPIQPSLVAYYLQSTAPKDLLVNLMFERAVVKVIDGGCNHSHSTKCERDFRNNPDDLEDMALFQMLAFYLRSLQLSAEPIIAKKQPQVIKAGGTTINITSGSGSTDPGSAADSANPGSKPATQYRLCFSPRDPALAKEIEKAARCGNADDKTTDRKIAGTTELDGITFPASLADPMRAAIKETDEIQKSHSIDPSKYINDQFEYNESIKSFSGRKVSITLTLRSTAAIFNYLGQLVHAAQDGPEITLYAPRFKPGPPNLYFPCWLPMAQSVKCKSIFSVVADTTPPPLVTVTYAGSVYSVPGDPNVSYSPDVLTLLKQLIALNLSAKSLPTTAILSLTPTQ